MLGKLLSTTAVSLLLVGGAVAQQAGSDAREGTPLFNYESDGTMTSETGYFEADDTQVLASNIIGENVYDGPGDDAEHIGDVNDIILGPDGLAEAVIIGVGGFLGVGEKEVAVDFNRLSWLERDDDRVLVLAATREELETAPDFDRAVLAPADGGSAARSTVRGDNVASGETPRDGDNAAGGAAAGAVATSAGTAAEADKQDRAAASDAARTEERADQRAAADADDADENRTDQRAAADADDPDEDRADQSAAVDVDDADDADEQANVSTDERTSAVPTVAPDAAGADDDWVVVERSEITADELMGADVHGADNADLGDVSDIVLTADGKVEAYVVDVGGFLGMFAKPVAIDAGSVDVMRNSDGDLRIITSYNADRLKEQTAYSKEAYEADRDAVVLR